jgi:hypothetical protein
MRRLALAFVVLLAGVLAVVVYAGGAGGGSASAAPVLRLKPIQQRLVSGTASMALDRRSVGAPAPQRAQGRPATFGPTSETGCPVNRGANVRVNQNCLNLSDPDLAGRGQAQNETSIAQDPFRPSRMVASQNDYRRGDGNCYSAYSTDGGRNWEDSTPPMSFTRGQPAFGFARQYWAAGGDTSVAWDTKGNAYLSCQVFNRGLGVSNNPDQSSAFYVFRSTQSGGASWNFPARPVAEQEDSAGAGDTLLDKQLMTVDNHKGSPYQDRVYVTWTFYDSDGTSYIYESYSKDYAEHFSPPHLVSTSSALCSNTLGIPVPQGSCNTNQFSQPFTGPDGKLYVAFNNYNVTGLRPNEGDEDGGESDRNATPPAGIDNRAQVLLARSDDGGETFGPPVKVSDFYDLPDCETYQDGKDAGRACVPEKGPTANSYFRAANYPSGAVNPRRPNEVQVTFGSYINRHSKESNGCVPMGYNPDTFQALYTGVKEPGACNNDILVSRSTNRGTTFTGTTQDVRTLPDTRSSDPRKADQFWQWAAFDPKGRLAVSFYDRAYGNDEYTGYSDVSLSGSNNGVAFGTVRVTTSSMPPPTQFEGTFFGDYSGLSAEDVAHPYWMDTRDPNLYACRDSSGNVVTPPRVCTGPAEAGNADRANDQNGYTQSLGIPLP